MKFGGAIKKKHFRHDKSHTKKADRAMEFERGETTGKEAQKEVKSLMRRRRQGVCIVPGEEGGVDLPSVTPHRVKLTHQLPTKPLCVCV